MTVTVDIGIERAPRLAAAERHVDAPRQQHRVTRQNRISEPTSADTESKAINADSLRAMGQMRQQVGPMLPPQRNLL